MTDPHYLRLLAREYPNADAAASEIINLNAILCLPKGTEYFFSDLHGESEAFGYLLNSASGITRDKIEWLFQKSVSLREREELANLVYAPEQVLSQKDTGDDSYCEWCEITIYRLVQVCKTVASKYTRSKVRKKMPETFAYVIDELLHADTEDTKEQYYGEIIHSITRTGMAEKFIITISRLIRQCSIDMLHIIGDIFDRGPHADLVMDELMGFHDVDIEWGNHDVSWMGAATGNLALVANVVRLGISYNNFDLLEDGYGISLRPLSLFAEQTYANSDVSRFLPRAQPGCEDSQEDLWRTARMHKAIAVIQFKLEGRLIRRRPDFGMEERLLLDKINYEKGTICMRGKEYPLKDTHFPTIDPKDPYRLTKEEEYVMEHLITSFKYCAHLQEHVRFLFSKGSMYLTYNDMVLYHGCVPLNADGSFRQVKINGKKYAGKALCDVLEHHARQGYFEQENSPKKKYGQDIMWYIWSNENSPVYGKDKMATFERYFVEDPDLKKETKDYYYQLIEEEAVLYQILEEFDADGMKGHVVNGHMPVAVKDGESPIKCKGKLFIIDGGFSKAYQKKTGIAGYTLVSNSYGIKLVAHEPFKSRDFVIREETDIHSDTVLSKKVIRRKRVGDTDNGKRIKESIKDLGCLVTAYRKGEISERI